MSRSSAPPCRCGHRLWQHNPPRFWTLNLGEECRSCPCERYEAPQPVIPAKNEADSVTSEGRGTSAAWLLHPPTQQRQGWTWECQTCGWRGLGCPAEEFARREASNHNHREHLTATARTGCIHGLVVCPTCTGAGQ